MKTQVVMKREIFGHQIRQQSKTGFFSATDLAKFGNKWRVANDYPMFNLFNYLGSTKTKEFMDELENKYGKCIVRSRGRGANTWVHPLLFIDIALAINPRLKVEVYSWLFDNLIKFRNDSGDSYREMAAALYKLYPNKSDFPNYISNVAKKIQFVVGVDNWQEASESQLDKRNNIHRSIRLLCNVLNNHEEAVRLGIKESIKISGGIYAKKQ